MTGRRNHNKRVAVLRALERSGLSMAEFCRRKGLSYGTVAAWRGTARRRRVRFIEIQPEPPVPPVPPVMSVPPVTSVDAVEAAVPASIPRLCAELALPGGAVLRIYHVTGEGGAA